MAPRLLLIEDEPDLLRALSLRFTAAGFLCETACNGKVGMAHLHQTKPDLIITDLIMPEMDGYELVRQVKADARTASVPVIVLTAIPKQGLESRANELPLTHVLHKPFEFQEVLSMVRKLLPTPPGGRLDG